MGIHPRLRSLYLDFRRKHPDSIRSERWEHLRDSAMEGERMTAADHRGLQIAFDQLEREWSTSPAA